LLCLLWRWEVSGTICPGWPLTVILRISASQVPRITDVSHGCLARQKVFTVIIPMLELEPPAFAFMEYILVGGESQAAFIKTIGQREH
jgi:hypothetical protein